VEEGERPHLEARKGKAKAAKKTPKKAPEKLPTTPKPPKKTPTTPKTTQKKKLPTTPKKTTAPKTERPTSTPTPKGTPVAEDTYKVPYPTTAVDICPDIGCEDDEDIVAGGIDKRDIGDLDDIETPSNSSSPSQLEKRLFGTKAVPLGRKYNAYLGGATSNKIVIQALTYPKARDLYGTRNRAHLDKLVYSFKTTSITKFEVGKVKVPTSWGRAWATEHILEVGLPRADCYSANSSVANY
jgi:outer membrane biosynthesis protein TonB